MLLSAVWTLCIALNMMLPFVRDRVLRLLKLTLTAWRRFRRPPA